MPVAFDTTETGLAARLWRRRYLFAVLLVGVFMFAAIVTFSLSPIYSASGAVIVGDDASISNATPVEWLQKLGDPADLESQLLIIRSPRMQRIALSRPGVLDAVLRECHLSQDGGLLPRVFGRRDTCAKLKASSEDLLNYVQTRYSVNAVGRSRVISIGYQSSLADVSFIMANALILAYLEEGNTDRPSRRDATSIWLLKKAHKLDRELAELNDQIVSGTIKSAKGGTNFDFESVRTLRQQLALAEAKEDQAAARMAGIGFEGDEILRAIPGVADLRQRLLVVETKAAVAFSPPEAEKLKRIKNELEAQIKAATQEAVDQAKQARAEARAQVEALRGRVQALEQEANAASRVSTDKVRGVEVQRDFYLELYRRAIDLESEHRVPASKAQLVNLAEIPTLPLFPKRTPMLAAAMIVALIAALGVALARDVMDKTVWSAGRLETLTGAPVLGRIPSVTPAVRGYELRNCETIGESDTPAAYLQVRSQRLFDRLAGIALTRLARLSYTRLRDGVVSTLVLSRPQLSLADALSAAEQSVEACRAIGELHARLMLWSDMPSQTLLVTSAGSAEGKTFTSVALARHAARMGRKVLLVDCNFCRPGVASALNCAARTGMLEALNGTLDPQTVMSPTDIPNLHVIAATSLPGGATELLMGGRFADVLHLARNYALVLIDGPAANSGMDASFIAKQVDGVICCTRWRHATEADTGAAIEHLRKVGATRSGIVITVVEESLFTGGA